MTLRSSGFWSLMLGFFWLMQQNETPIPPAPEQELPSFSNQMQVEEGIQGEDRQVTVSVFESPNCAECHPFALNSVVPTQQRYEPNALVSLNVYVIPQSTQEEEMNMAKALLCAREQKQFWPLYQAFHTQETLLNPKQLEDLILEKELEMDWGILKTCLENEETQKTLEAHQTLAQSRVQLFPTTFIEDTQLIHNQPLENLTRVIDKKTRALNQEQFKNKKQEMQILE